MLLIDIVYRPGFIAKTISISHRGEIKLGPVDYFCEARKHALCAHVDIYPMAADDFIFGGGGLSARVIFSEVPIYDDVYFTKVRSTPHGIERMVFAFKDFKELR